MFQYMVGFLSDIMTTSITFSISLPQRAFSDSSKYHLPSITSFKAPTTTCNTYFTFSSNICLPNPNASAMSSDLVCPLHKCSPESGTNTDKY